MTQSQTSLRSAKAKTHQDHQFNSNGLRFKYVSIMTEWCET